MFCYLLPEPIIFWVFFYPFFVFLQCLLVNGTFYEASVLIGGTQVSYRACLARLSVLVMLDLVGGLDEKYRSIPIWRYRKASKIGFPFLNRQEKSLFERLVSIRSVTDQPFVQRLPLLAVVISL